MDFKTFGLSQTQALVLIIVGSVVALVVLFLLLFKFVFTKKALRKQIRELDSRFQYLHALLIGQDAQYVRRLEIISRTNLLYVEIHTKFNKRFKEVRDKHDSNAQSIINKLKDLADDKHYKALKEALVDAKDSIKAYENEVNLLNEDLLKVVRPEEECRQQSLVLKERLRAIKGDYFKKQADLSLVQESFDEIFKYIDTQFETFENFIESAQYEDAKLILPRVEKVLNEIEKALVDLPTLCASVVSYLPDRIVSLENAYEIMTQDNFPLNHLCVASSIKEMKIKVDNLVVKIKQFNLSGVADEVDNLVSRIDEFLKLFEEERKAREIFDLDNESTYDTVNMIEKRFIKLCNKIPEVSKIYVINEDQKAKINSIQNNINKLGALKRSLDTFIHSSTKQPYSLLVEKMSELTEASKTVITSMDDFDKYLLSLRLDSEAAYQIIHEYYYKVKEAEKIIRDMNNGNISEKYAEKIARFYELLSNVYKTLNTSPISVGAVNECVNELHEINNDLFDNGAINEDNNLMILAENTILSVNRQRYRLSDINALAKQAELLFSNGEFEKSYIVAGNALKKITSASTENESK